MVSINTQPGLHSAIFCRTASRSQMSTKFTAMPSGSSTFMSIEVVAP